MNMQRATTIRAPEGAAVVGGLSILGAGLFSIGIPKDSIVKYEAAIKTDQFLLIVHGNAEEVAKGKEILDRTHPVDLAVHAGEVPETAAV